MARSKDRSAEEHYKGIINAQKKQISHLKKELARANKNSNVGRTEELEKELSEYLIQEEMDEKLVEPKSRCDECSGELTILDLDIKRYHCCATCNFRKLIKK